MYRIILCTLLSFTSISAFSAEQENSESFTTTAVGSLPIQGAVLHLHDSAAQGLDASQVKSLLEMTSETLEKFEDFYQHNVHHFNHQAKPYDAFKMISYYEKPILKAFQKKFPKIPLPAVWDHPATLIAELGGLINKMGLCITRQEICLRSLQKLETHMRHSTVESTETHANVHNVLVHCCRLAMLLDSLDQSRSALGSSMLIESLYENIHEEGGCYAGYAGRFLRDYIYLMHFSLETLLAAA